MQSLYLRYTVVRKGGGDEEEEDGGRRGLVNAEFPMLGQGYASGRDRKRRTMALHWPENVWNIQVPEPDRLDGASVPK